MESFSARSDFTGTIFIGELSAADSAGALRQGVFTEYLYHKAYITKYAK